MELLFGDYVAGLVWIGLILAAVGGLWLFNRLRRLESRTAHTPDSRSYSTTTAAHWPGWEASIRTALMQYGWVEEYFLSAIPPNLRAAAMRRYVQEHADDALILTEDPPTIELANRQRMKTFLHGWKAAWELVESEQNFDSVVAELAAQFCAMLGFVYLGEERRIYHALHAVMVRAPALRLKVPPRFPIVFVRRREGSRQDVHDLRSLMSILDVTSYFALIVDLNDLTSRLDPSKNLKNLTREMTHDFIVLDGQDWRQIIMARDPGKRLVELMLQQVDLTVVSPYVISGPVPDNMFFGRDHELKTVTRKIDSTSFALIGGRKIGKTSILAKIYRLLSDNGQAYSTLYLDCQAVTRVEAFLEAASTLWNMRPALYSPQDFRHCVVASHQEHIGMPLVILLDEVDALLENDRQHGHALFGVFRALSQENRCRFVFCGERVLYRQLHAADSPLFNFCDAIQLGYLQEQAVWRIVQEPMQTMGVSIQNQDEVIAEIINLSSCHPNLVQYLCQQMILEANSRHSRVITSLDLAQVRHSSQFHEFFLQVTWGNTTALERVITLLVADHELLSLGDMEDLLARRGFAVPQDTLNQAIAGLRLYSILIKEGQHYRFASRVFAEIIHESQEIDVLLTSLRNQVRDMAALEGWTPLW